jgi:hypothetical protein
MSDHRPHGVKVLEGDTAGIYCPTCIKGYLGDPDHVEEINLEHVGETLLCKGCGADLSNPDGYGRDGESS